MNKKLIYYSAFEVKTMTILKLQKGATDCALSRVRPFATPWTVAHQAPLSMELSRQEYWSGLPLPSPWDLPDPGVKPESPASPAFEGCFFTTVPPRKPYLPYKSLINCLMLTQL